MRRRKLTPNFQRSTALIEEDGTKITATSFATALSSFALDHLRGAIVVEHHGESDGIISVSPNLAAHAIKTIVSYAKPDELVHLNINIDSVMDMEIIFRELPSSEILSHLMNLSRSYGFAVSRSEKSITLTADIRIEQTIKVYAISACDFERILLDIFDL